VSRRHDARRKAKRREARAAAADPACPKRPILPWRPVIPILAIAAILFAAAILGLGAGDSRNQQQVRQEVTALLTDIPQDGSTLGSSRAPITLWMFADLKCPTVKRFVEAYLPSIIETWVRNGTLKVEYRSLQTDTSNERSFFEQETAALAAGRQDRMWNFLLTFVHQQGQAGTDYATDEFLVDMASQVPGLRLRPWHVDREDPLLSRQVAIGVYTARGNGMRSTPSFMIGLSKGQARDRREDLDGVTAAKEEIELSLREEIQALGEEDLGDVPTLSPYLGGNKKTSND